MKGLLFILIIAMAHSGVGQADRAKTSRKYRDSLARVYIQDLSEGCLLIRLRTSIKKMEALKARGDTALALNEARMLKLKHLEIISSFKLNYSFSKVYYFYSHHSGKVRSREFQGILMNEQFEPVDEEPDVFLILDPYVVDFTHMNSQQQGLSLLNDRFEQLERPFPYYVRKREALFFLRRDYQTMVALLQKNLEFTSRKYLGIRQ